MKILTAILLSVLFNSKCFSQSKGDNTIKVHGVGFLQICNALLDSGYIIEKKDNELQTAKTELKEYPRLWNAYYSIGVRVKDSVAIITGYITGPYKTGGLFKDEKMSYEVNKKGKPYDKSIFTFGFLILDNFAKSFNKPIIYSKE